MSPEAQRIAIAEACGYTHINIIRSENYDRIEDGVPVRPKVIGIMGRASNGPTKTQPWIPDYLNDLNAMHEAEARFNNSKDADAYMRNLLRVVRNLIIREDSFILNSWTTYALVHATAAQRARAFLETLNKWEDDT